MSQASLSLLHNTSTNAIVPLTHLAHQLLFDGANLCLDCNSSTSFFESVKYIENLPTPKKQALKFLKHLKFLHEI